MIDNIGVNKIVVSYKISFGKNDFKHFIGYKYAKKDQTFIHISSKNEWILKTFWYNSMYAFFIKDEQPEKKNWQQRCIQWKVYQN